MPPVVKKRVQNCTLLNLIFQPKTAAKFKAAVFALIVKQETTTRYARGIKKAMPMRKRKKKPSSGRMDAGLADRIAPKEGIQ